MHESITSITVRYVPTISTDDALSTVLTKLLGRNIYVTKGEKQREMNDRLVDEAMAILDFPLVKVAVSLARIITGRRFRQ